MIFPTSGQRLVIVGASTRSAAQCASRAGFSALALDQFLDRDLKRVAVVEPLQSMFALDDVFWEPWIGAPLLLCGGMENRSDAIDHLVGRGLVCGAGSRTLSLVRNPEAWARWSAASRMGYPESPNRFEQIASQPCCGDWLVKSHIGAGGLGIRVWQGERLERSEYLQRRLDGEVLGVTFLNHRHGARLIGCMKAWPADSFWGPLPFIYRGSVGPVGLSAEEAARLSDFGAAVGEETGLRGVWQADFLRNDEGWWLLEINPRWSSSMELLESACGVALVAEHVAAVMNTPQVEQKPPARDRRDDRFGKSEVDRCIGKVVRYASHDIYPPQSLLEHWWARRWNGAWSELCGGNRLADIPADASCIPAGYPICTEFACGSSIEEVQRRLERSVLAFDGSPTQ